MIDRQAVLRATLDADATYIYFDQEMAAGGVAETVTVARPFGMRHLDFEPPRPRR